MEYTSTRNNECSVTSAQAILAGLAPDGGLFVPRDISAMDMESLKGCSYTEIALAVLKHLLSDYDVSFLEEAVKESYGVNFDDKAGHMVKLDDNLHVMELWHGPTSAFKDYALQLMPKLLVQARKTQGETDETMILVATSGDTGSAALAGYSNIPGVKIAVFYPENGTSLMQRLQMTTQTGKNVSVYGIKGNFDDAQKGVKETFSDKELAKTLAEKNVKLSSANSINWGRLVPQIVYYVSSYLSLCENGDIKYGDEVDYCVPTGNFGDIMAGWYAKQMGLPVGKLICASNKNNVLSEFFSKGYYNANREFHKTSSPSMDILVSSNLERLLWHISGDGEKVKQWMSELSVAGAYQIDEEMLQKINEVFVAGWAGESSTREEIAGIWQRYRYLCDPHTAVAFRVLRQQNENTDRPTVIVSTASPYKFPKQVLDALGKSVPEDEFAALQKLEKCTDTEVPVGLLSLIDKEERFKNVISPSDISGIPLKI